MNSIVGAVVGFFHFFLSLFGLGSPTPTPAVIIPPMSFAEQYQEEMRLHNISEEDMEALNVSARVLDTYPSDLVLVYTTLVRNVLSQHRQWSTYDIWIKRGMETPEKLATMGGVGVYMGKLTLSPDHTSILINTEKSLLLLNIQTKEVRTIFSTDQGIPSAIFSLDGTQVWVAEGSIFGTAKKDARAIHVVDVKTGTVTAVGGTDLETWGDLALVTARADGILIYEPLTYTDGYPDRHFAVNTKTDTVIRTQRTGVVSESGMVSVGASVSTVPNDCVSEMGLAGETTPSQVQVVEPVSGKVLATIGRVNEVIDVVSFSPDDTQALYASYTDFKGCAFKQSTYYVQVLTSGSEPQQVDDINAILKLWNRPIFSSRGVSDQAQKVFTNTITLGTYTLEKSVGLLEAFVPRGSGSPIEVVGGYYR